MPQFLLKAPESTFGSGPSLLDVAPMPMGIGMVAGGLIGNLAKTIAPESLTKMRASGLLLPAFRLGKQIWKGGIGALHDPDVISQVPKALRANPNLELGFFHGPSKQFMSESVISDIGKFLAGLRPGS